MRVKIRKVYFQNMVAGLRNRINYPLKEEEEIQK